MPDYEYICLECGHQFNRPRRYVETHGLETPPYELLSCCPECGGGYDEAVECEGCARVIPMSEATRLVTGTWLCDECLARCECEDVCCATFTDGNAPTTPN